MSLKKQKPAEYLSHPVGLRNDYKIKPFRNKFGSDGYMFCICWAEFLGAQDGWEAELDEFLVDDLAEDFGFEVKRFNEIFDFALKKGWLIKEERSEEIVIFSHFVNNVMLARLNKKRNYNKTYQKGKRDGDSKEGQEDTESNSPMG